MQDPPPKRSEPVRHRFSTADMRRMQEAGVLRGARVELIDGDLIDQPGQTPVHAALLGVMAELLHWAYDQKRRIRVRSPLEVGDDLTLPEPDLAVVRGAVRDFWGRYPRGDEAVLVVEIAHSSLAHDRRKKAWYAHSGVPEYWIVDLQHCAIEVCTDPARDAGVYRTERSVGLAGTVTPPETALEWSVSGLLLG